MPERAATGRAAGVVRRGGGEDARAAGREDLLAEAGRNDGVVWADATTALLGAKNSPCC